MSIKRRTEWIHSWKSVQNTIGEFIESAELLVNGKVTDFNGVDYQVGSPPKVRTLLSLVKCLEEFGTDQFYFFLKGFENNYLDPELPIEQNRAVEGNNPPSPRVSPAVEVQFPNLDHVLYETIRQLSGDFELVIKAINQRIGITSINPRQTHLLHRLDILGLKCLDFAVDLGLLKKNGFCHLFSKKHKYSCNSICASCLNWSSIRYFTQD